MSTPHQITVVESHAFRRWVRQERIRRQVDALADELTENPRTGEVIPGTGGLRKIRMPKPGKGKRGGYRVIYAVLVDSRYLVLLNGYDKADQHDLSADDKRVLTTLAALMDADLRTQTRDPRSDTNE